ncbi:hypothetical protein XENTR_v10006929 [Xenopus tropicalis]|nr:hypothetical protein XENTR_v10006929 [Xenopus tropicalis]
MDGTFRALLNRTFSVPRKPCVSDILHGETTTLETKLLMEWILRRRPPCQQADTSLSLQWTCCRDQGCLDAILRLLPLDIIGCYIKCSSCENKCEGHLDHHSGPF